MPLQDLGASGRKSIHKLAAPVLPWQAANVAGGGELAESSIQIRVVVRYFDSEERQHERPRQKTMFVDRLEDVDVSRLKHKWRSFLGHDHKDAAPGAPRSKSAAEPPLKGAFRSEAEDSGMGVGLAEGGLMGLPHFRRKLSGAAPAPDCSQKG